MSRFSEDNQDVGGEEVTHVWLLLQMLARYEGLVVVVVLVLALVASVSAEAEAKADAKAEAKAEAKAKAKASYPTPCYPETKYVNAYQTQVQPVSTTSVFKRWVTRHCW